MGLVEFPGPGLAGDDRGVSEVVGFLNIMAVILLAVSIVYGAGYPALVDTRDKHYRAAVDEAFRVIAFNINRIVTGAAPSQSMEVRLRDSTISLLRESTLNLSYWEYNATSRMNESTSRQVTLLTVEAEHRERKVAYEGGGVWAHSASEGAASLVDPAIVVDVNRSLVNIPVAVLLGSNVSRGGGGVARVVVERYCPSSGACLPTLVEGNASNLTLRVQSDYCPAWLAYLNTTLSLPMDDSDCTDTAVRANLSSRLSNRLATVHLSYVNMVADIE